MDEREDLYTEKIMITGDQVPSHLPPVYSLRSTASFCTYLFRMNLIIAHHAAQGSSCRPESYAVGAVNDYVLSALPP